MLVADPHSLVPMLAKLGRRLLAVQDLRLRLGAAGPPGTLDLLSNGIYKRHIQNSYITRCSNPFTNALATKVRGLDQFHLISGLTYLRPIPLGFILRARPEISRRLFAD